MQDSLFSAQTPESKETLEEINEDLLRDPSKKREVWDDMKKVRDYLNETKKQ